MNSPQQRTGFLVGRIEVPDDFDRLGEAQIVELFESSSAPPEQA